MLRMTVRGLGGLHVLRVVNNARGAACNGRDLHASVARPLPEHLHSASGCTAALPRRFAPRRWDGMSTRLSALAAWPCVPR